MNTPDLHVTPDVPPPFKPGSRTLIAALAGLVLGYLVTAGFMDFHATGRISLPFPDTRQAELTRTLSEFWSMTTVMTEFYQSEGKWPTRADLEKSNPALLFTDGTGASRVDVDAQGRIILTLREKFEGAHLVFAPELFHGGAALRWRCNSPDISADSLPAVCKRQD